MSNITFNNGKIPIAHFFRGFWGVGVQIALSMQHDKTKTQAAHDAINYLMSEVIPVNLYDILMGYDEKANSFTMNRLGTGVYKAASTITAVSPEADVLANRDFKGAQVYNEDTWKQGKANKDLGKKDVHPAFQAFSNWLFDVGGGKTDKDGKVIKSPPKMFDQNPSKLEHLASGYVPGVGVAVKDLVQQLIADETDWNKMPITRRFYKPYDQERSFLSEYWALKRVVDNWEGEKDATYWKAWRTVENTGSAYDAEGARGIVEKIRDRKDIPQDMFAKRSMRDRIKDMRALRRTMIANK
jgi:hypothetical protein